MKMMAPARGHEITMAEGVLPQFKTASPRCRLSSSSSISISISPHPRHVRSVRLQRLRLRKEQIAGKEPGRRCHRLGSSFSGHEGVDISLSLLHSSAHLVLFQAKKGGFKDTRPEEILSGVLRAVYTKVGLDPALIEDITVGNVLPPGSGASAARMAELHAGIPITTPISTVNRQCSSGLAATNNIAALITSGQIDIGLGA